MTPRHEDVTVGVDVGGTSTRIVVFSDVGEQIDARTSATPVGGTALLDHLGDGIAESVAVDSRRLTGVGVGIPGGVAGDGTVTDGTYPDTTVPNGGYTILELPSREAALEWAAKIAVACRCAQEVRQFMYDPES